MDGRQDKLHRMFRSDSKIMLESLTSLIADLENGDRSDEKLGRAFRAAHSLKSEAGFLELKEITDAAHALEEALSGLRHDSELDPSDRRLSRQLEVLKTLIGRYHAGTDGASTSPARRVGDGASTPRVVAGGPPSAAPARQEEVVGVAAVRSLGAEGMLREARQRSERLFRVIVRLAGSAEMRYPRAFLVLNNLELACAVIDITPPLESISGGDTEQVTLLVTTSGDDRSIRRAVAVDEVELVEVTELSYDEVSVVKEEDTSELSESGNYESRPIQVSPASQEEIALLADEIHRTLVDLNDTELRTDAGRETATHLATLATRYAEVLRDQVDWSTRVQLLDVFRDLRQRSVTYGAQQRKRVRLSVTGSGAVVFSGVADTLTDAVLHLIRNSIDHGIESIEARAGSGKPPAGTITVQVDRLGETIQIAVTDDGIGIDEKLVRAKAKDDERALVDILASPGFTTRERAETGSGRGIGLDNVMHTVRDLLSGSLSIENSPGKGVSVRIRVSARNRLTHVAVVDSIQGNAAVPMSSLVAREQLDLRRLKRDSFGVVYYDFQGDSLPGVTILGSMPNFGALTPDELVMVVRMGRERRALIVSGVVAQEAVVRDYNNPRKVYSKMLGREIPFVFPPAAFR